MVDPQRVRALLGRLAERLSRLRAYADLSTERYLENAEKVAASKYFLLTSIEDALSVANHVIASEGMRSPVDLADSFRVLRDAQILDPPLSERLQAMARFRNLLVHEYATVDDARVHHFLREDLKDLDSFASAILSAFPDLGHGGSEPPGPGDRR